MSRSGKSLSDVGETELIRLLTNRWSSTLSKRVLVGAGDDCAVLREKAGSSPFLFKTDAIVEDVHFTTNAPPSLVGRKALARNLSDIAAMGGEPRAALVTVAAPAETPVNRLRAMYDGLGKLAQQYNVALVGGETVCASTLMLSVSLLGVMPTGVQPVLRSTAKAGDEIWVTGKLGGTQKRKHLTFEPRLAAGQWLAKNKLASAMMDLSDGLGADLPKLATASGLGFDVDENRLPRARGVSIQAAWNDGEDYELLFTVRPTLAAKLRKAWPWADLPISCLGQMRKNSLAGRRGANQAGGYDHFGRT